MPSDDLRPQPDRQRCDARTSEPEAPGALRGQVWLTLQTRQAQQLIRDRPGTSEKPTIVGLIGLADRLRLLWQAARQDDPYADWWLIKIHAAIEAASTRIGDRQAELDRQREQTAGLEVTIAASLRSVKSHFGNILSSVNRRLYTVSAPDGVNDRNQAVPGLSG